MNNPKTSPDVIHKFSESRAARIATSFMAFATACSVNWCEVDEDGTIYQYTSYNLDLIGADHYFLFRAPLIMSKGTGPHDFEEIVREALKVMPLNYLWQNCCTVAENTIKALTDELREGLEVSSMQATGTVH